MGNTLVEFSAVIPVEIKRDIPRKSLWKIPGKLLRKSRKEHMLAMWTVKRDSGRNCKKIHDYIWKIYYENLALKSRDNPWEKSQTQEMDSEGDTSERKH